MTGQKELTAALRWWDRHDGADAGARRTYDNRNSRQFVAAATAALLRLPQRRATTVVDIGCGDGAMLRNLASAEWASCYIGIDPNPEMNSTSDIAIVTGSAQDAPEIVANIDGAVFISATLTLGLWDQPERILGTLLLDCPNVQDIFIADIIRPATPQAWAIWRSFGLNQEEVRYLEDQAAIIPTWARWSHLIAALGRGSDISVETFDLRMPGIRSKQCSELAVFEETSATSDAPQGIWIHAYRKSLTRSIELAKGTG